MAVRGDLTVDYTVSPRVATIAAPSTTVTIQDMYDTLATEHARAYNSTYTVLIKAAGKDDLGGGKRVGITATLLNSKIAFEARPGPTYIQCSVTDGNLVAVDASDVSMTSVQVTAFTQIVVEKSTSPSLVKAGGLVVVGE